MPGRGSGSVRWTPPALAASAAARQHERAACGGTGNAGGRLTAPLTAMPSSPEYRFSSHFHTLKRHLKHVTDARCWANSSPIPFDRLGRPGGRQSSLDAIPGREMALDCVRKNGYNFLHDTTHNRAAK